MGIVNMDSEYIYDFITCKQDQNAINNFNLSVGIVNDDIFRGKNYYLKDYSTNTITDTLCNVNKLLDTISYNAWKNGEPGIIFLDKVNKYNPISEDIVATNP